MLMRNLTMMTDLYQLTMMNGYFRYGKRDQVSVFDMFFRGHALQLSLIHIYNLHRPGRSDS